MMSRVDGIAPADVRIGMAVRARIVDAKTMRRWSSSSRWRGMSDERLSARQDRHRRRGHLRGRQGAGLQAIELAAQASLLALAEAGLHAARRRRAVRRPAARHARRPELQPSTSGIQPKLTDNNRTGGSSFLVHLEHAALALDAGLCDVALIAYGSNQRTASGKLVQTSRPSPWEAPYKPLRPISSYALAAARHMHQYGTTKRQLAEVAVAARHWAQLNPEAFARDAADARQRSSTRAWSATRSACATAASSPTAPRRRDDARRSCAPTMRARRSTCSARRQRPRTPTSPPCPTSP